jgi:beta-aspartyl-dipeptidase (metallo-type)
VAHELARLANDAFVAGMLSRKAGLTHLHVGDHPTRLAPLRDVLEHFAVEPGWFYATHVERSEELMSEAIEIAARGVAVDIDVVEEDLTRWLPYYLEHDGDPGQLTVSSDAGVNSPRTVLQQIRRCVQARHVPLELALSLVTKNPARILKLEEKGAVEAGKWGDLLVLEKGSLEIVHVLAKGAFMVRDGSLVAEPRFLADSNREIHAVGGKRRREEG